MAAARPFYGKFLSMTARNVTEIVTPHRGSGSPQGILIAVAILGAGETWSKTFFVFMPWPSP
jgi:hypothetical protein